MTLNRQSHVYVGLAGETAPGRPVKSGLYRMAVGDDRWELATRGLPAAPAIRAIATHPEDADTVYVGTQDGPYRSTDHGEHWEKLDVPDHGLPVWSLAFDPRNARVLYAGYENCEIYRSEDGGEHWRQLPVNVRFPEITVAAGSNPAKRVLKLAANPANPDEIYGAVDRGGLFCSADRGEHWASGRLEPLNPNGQTYCRDIREAPGDSKTIWVAAGATFQSEVGVLFRSKDGGVSWSRVDMGVKPKTTMFTLAFDTRQPRRMFCATSGGEVFASEDGGQSWGARPLPEGATQVYAMGCS